MTQEQKDLLLKDLCARLPYGVKAHVKHWSNLDWKYYEGVYTVKSTFPSLNEVHVQSKTGSVDVILGYTDYVIKPYLFPLESMTDEQKEEHKDLLDNQYSFDADGNIFTLQDFYCKYHLDFRGLIDKGDAIDATGLNIY
jgi:hypothetical protein